MLEKKILVVDDEAELRKLYTLILPKEEYQVICAASAEEALELLGREKIYVMFLDLNLPGMDGMQLCKKIRQNEPFAHISAVTGYTSIFQLADCRAAGFDDYFAKPFKREALIRVAAYAFDRLERWKGATE
ncbi:MAG: response regulator [Desulfobulbaceae bacterium]|nr:response regulator [Desulfobulbaceae bacterium]